MLFLDATMRYVATEPLRQRQEGILEDSSGRDPELIVAREADMLVPARDRRHAVGLLLFSAASTRHSFS
jgi:hypothetical protein